MFNNSFRTLRRGSIADSRGVEKKTVEAAFAATNGELVDGIYPKGCQKRDIDHQSAKFGKLVSCVT